MCIEETFFFSPFNMTMPTLETRILWELSTINLEGLDVWLYCYYTHIHATRRSRNELTLHVYKDRSDVETAVTAMMEPPPVQQKKWRKSLCGPLFFIRCTCLQAFVGIDVLAHLRVVSCFRAKRSTRCFASVSGTQKEGEISGLLNYIERDLPDDDIFLLTAF